MRYTGSARGPRSKIAHLLVGRETSGLVTLDLYEYGLRGALTTTGILLTDAARRELIEELGGVVPVETRAGL